MIESMRETEYQSMRSLMKYAAQEGETSQLLASALKQELTERQAQIVRLYYLNQLPMREIANVLGINVSTVSRSLKSSRERLRRCLRYMNRAFLHPDT